MALRARLPSLCYTLIGMDERCVLETSGVGDGVGTLEAPVAADLDPLAVNGGGAADSPPANQSPTIDAVPAADCVDTQAAPLNADQRGFARPDGEGCEIGAHEIGCGDGGRRRRRGV